MAFVPKKAITITEKEGYITDLTANYCYKGLSHTVCTVSNWNEFVHVLFST